MDDVAQRILNRIPVIVMHHKHISVLSYVKAAMPVLPYGTLGVSQARLSDHIGHNLANGAGHHYMFGQLRYDMICVLYFLVGVGCLIRLIKDHILFMAQA